MSITKRRFRSSLFFLAICCASRANAQTSTAQFNVAGPADWNAASSWISTVGPVIPGDGFTQEVVGISNGGTATLATAARFPVDGLILGEAFVPNSAGRLEIGPVGSLTVQPGFGTLLGAVLVGEVGGGKGELVVNGGTLNAVNLRVNGAADSLLQLSGAANVNISENIILDRRLRIEGPAVDFRVAGNVDYAGQLEAVVTGPTHSPIKTDGQFFIGIGNRPNNVVVEFQGHTPAYGESWTLVDAASIEGTFRSVASAAPMPRGLVLGTTYGGGEAQINVENRLVLTVNRGSGAVSFTNAAGAPIVIDGYTINSPDGFLNSANGTWTSLDDGNVGAWTEANPTSTRLSELNPTGSTSFAAGQTRSLGTPYDFAPTAFGNDLENLTFEYVTPDGERLQGFIEYSGPHNNLVLRVDPSNGSATLLNESTFSASIDGYSISSASGSLRPNSWSSLDDQNIGAWAEANPSAGRISELNPTGAAAFAQGTSFQLGGLFNPAGTRDLTLEFTLSTGERIFGAVEYGATGQAGDTDDDGDVDLDDLNAVRNNFGATGDPGLPGDAFPFDGTVDLDDLNGVRNNFGAGGSAAVPEPATWALAAVFGCVGVFAKGRRRK